MARSLEFKVGLLILTASAILVAFVAILGNFSLRSGFTIYVDYDYIGSLQAGAPVKVSGIKVGKVTDVTFWGGKLDAAIDKRVQVRLEVWIEDRARDSVRADAEMFINTAGMLGEQYLEIVPGSDWSKPPIASNTVFHGLPAVHEPPRTDLVVARLYEVLDGVAVVLRDQGDAIENLLSNGAAVVKQANELLHDNRERIASLIGNGADLAKEAKLTLVKVNHGLGDGRQIGTLVRDVDATLLAARDTMTSLTPPARALMTDAARVTSMITEARLDKALAAADTAANAAGKAGGLIDNVNGMVGDMRSGKGTAGALLARDDVYRDLRELIRDLKRNPWKLFWKE